MSATPPPWTAFTRAEWGIGESYDDNVVFPIDEDRYVIFPGSIRATAVMPDGTRVSGVIVTTEPEFVPGWQEITFTAPEGGTVPSAVARGIGVADLLEASIAEIGLRFVRQHDGRMSMDMLASKDEHRLTRDEVNAMMGRRRWRTTEGELRSAAAAYLEAKATGTSDPMQATADAIFTSRATAGRRIKRARLLGLLEED